MTTRSAATRILATGLSTSAVLLIMTGMDADREPEAAEVAPTPAAPAAPAPPASAAVSPPAEIRTVVVRKPQRRVAVRPAPAAAPVHSTSRAS